MNADLKAKYKEIEDQLEGWWQRKVAKMRTNLGTTVAIVAGIAGLAGIIVGAKIF